MKYFFLSNQDTKHQLNSAMPTNSTNQTLFNMIKTQVIQEIELGTRSFRDLEGKISLDMQYAILSELAERAARKFQAEVFPTLRAEILMRTADQFYVSEDMCLGWDGDREYVRDIYIKERFSDKLEPRVIKQFADHQMEEEEWDAFKPLIDKQQREDLAEELGEDWENDNIWYIQC